MSQPDDSRRNDAERRGDERREGEPRGGESQGEYATGERRGAGSSEYFAESTLRVSLAVVGFVLLLFALGQAIGIDLLGTIVDALNTQIGRWLVVAFFAILLIALAVRGFDRTAE